MSVKTKTWLIVAAFLVFVGLIIFGIVMIEYEWDFKKLSKTEYEENEYILNEKIQNISIVSDTADIVLVSSENRKPSVFCYESNNEKHTVYVKDGTLFIELNVTKKWYDYIGINFGSPKVVLYLPEGEYGSLIVKSSTSDVEVPDEFQFEDVYIAVSTGDVFCGSSVKGIAQIKASTGDIRIEGISAGLLDLTVSTGRIDVSDVICGGDLRVKVTTGKSALTDVECLNFISEGNTGDISMKNLVASRKISIERSTGDVDFYSCDADEISVTTDTGDVKGSLCSDKIFFTQTDTGKVEVPKSPTGGKCEITTDTGNIKITVG